MLASNWWQRRVLPQEISAAHRLDSAIRDFSTRWPAADGRDLECETPVFVLSAGWGSGSTLLQRLVASTGDCLIWGEPFDHAAPIHRLAQTIAPVSQRWPKPRYFEHPADKSSLQDRWIANLTPQPTYLREALQQAMICWLKVPAQERGYTYWGLKEVRLTIQHARFLKWLFPNARFLFTYRDVLKAYRSVKGVKWFSIWPGYRVSDVSHFAHHWRLLLEGFLDCHEQIGGRLIPYEDLVTGKIDLEDIGEYLGLGKIDPEVLSRKVGARSQNRPSVSLRERYIIKSITGNLRTRCGYLDDP
jgi:hypothetical protein